MGSRLESNSKLVRKRIESHTFDDEDGEEYGASKFGGFADYFRRKKIKLQNLDAERRSQNSDKPRIFRGVVAHVNGYTQPSLNDLHHLIVDYGGGFLQYMDGKTMVTHVIASSLTPSKKIEFRRYRVVKPAWVVDSIQAGKLLPWENYKVVDEGPRQHVLGFHSGNVVSQAGKRQVGYREQTDASWYTNQLQTMAEDLDESESDRPIRPDQGADPPATPSFAPPDEEIETLSANPHESLLGPETSRSPFQYTKRPSVAAAKVSSVFDLHPTTDDAFDMASSVGSESPNLQTVEVNAPEAPAKKAKTAEEHNAALLADPKVWKSTVVNPDFLKQYYAESRLHHLSTWKAELKSRLQALAREKTARKARKRPPGYRQYILHVDFDSFFAAVSLQSHPSLIDRPVVVAHGNGTGAEIASCNYPARERGVKNGMWMKRAQELCPNLKVLPYDFKAYEAASRDFYEVVMDTGGVVQSVSIDEALVDVSDICVDAGGSNGVIRREGCVDREQTKANEIATDVRAKIKERTQCNVSVGIGSNVLLAKVALRKAKPAGQYQIRPERVFNFLGPLSVQDLPGVAHSMGAKLEELGVKFVRDLHKLSKERLVSSMGPKTGEKLWEYARGIDHSEVGDQVVRKSVSAEVNWGVRFATQQQVDDFVGSLCEELQRRLLHEGVKARQLTMKVMRRAANVPLDPPKHLGHGPCDTFNKSMGLGVATNDKTVLVREAVAMLKSLNFSPGELRGLGVQGTKLEPIKSSDKPFDSSQKRLRFKLEPVRLAGTGRIAGHSKTAGSARHFVAGPAAMDRSAEPETSLNIMGTQFVLPTQADPAVLAELPPEIRARLNVSEKEAAQRGAEQSQSKPSARSVTPPPKAQGDEAVSQSQLDPEVLAALPEELRKEVLATYGRSDSRPNTTPRKLAEPPVKRQPTPKKARTSALGRGRPRGGKKQVGRSKLYQSNFIGTRAAAVDSLTDDTVLDADPEILAELPEAIRDEIRERQRRERLRRRGALGLTKRRKLRPLSDAPYFVALPARPPRPAFTAAKLTALPDLRGAISAWVEDFQSEEPNEEDVEMLAAYLKRVVMEEKDMSKAVAVVKWLDWAVGQDPTTDSLWEEAVTTVKEQVQTAIHQRGLGRVQF